MQDTIQPAAADGSRRIIRDGKCVGRLMPVISQSTLEASPGIQGWSHPRGKVSTRMFDPDSPARFAEQWSRNWAETYPLSGS